MAHPYKMLPGWVVPTSWQTWAQMNQNTEGLRSLAFNPTNERAHTRRQPTVLLTLPLSRGLFKLLGMSIIQANGILLLACVGY